MFAPAQNMRSRALVKHHAGDLGMLEADALQSVVQLDIDAEVVGVELELVARPQAAVFVDVHGQRGHAAVDGETPVAIVFTLRRT